MGEEVGAFDPRMGEVVVAFEKTVGGVAGTSGKRGEVGEACERR